MSDRVDGECWVPHRPGDVPGPIDQARDDVVWMQAATLRTVVAGLPAPGKLALLRALLTSGGGR